MSLLSKLNPTILNINFDLWGENFANNSKLIFYIDNGELWNRDKFFRKRFFLLVWMNNFIIWSLQWIYMILIILCWVSLILYSFLWKPILWIKNKKAIKIELDETKIQIYHETHHEIISWLKDNTSFFSVYYGVLRISPSSLENRHRNYVILYNEGDAVAFKLIWTDVIL